MPEPEELWAAVGDAVRAALESDDDLELEELLQAETEEPTDD